MSAAALAQPALRPFLPTDEPMLAQIFCDSIEELTGDDYDGAQRAAWMASADDPRFARRLAEQTTLIATRAGMPVGFVSLKDADHIDMLYVHPAAAHEGIGTFLCTSIETLARARGATKLMVDASDTALPFFERQGFRAEFRQSIACNGEWLANTRMQKKLETPTRSAPS